MSQYAEKARRYWETYLPSQVAEMSDPTAFFEDLATQVEDQIVEVTDDLHQGLVAKLPGTPTSRDLVAARRTAQTQAEQSVLRDLVFLTPEPGTEDLRQPGTVLPGWEDDAPAAE